MKLCVLVLIGVNEQGQKKLLAISDGVRESIQSWHELLLDLKERSFFTLHERLHYPSWQQQHRVSQFRKLPSPSNAHSHKPPWQLSSA